MARLGSELPLQCLPRLSHFTSYHLLSFTELQLHWPSLSWFRAGSFPQVLCLLHCLHGRSSRSTPSYSNLHLTQSSVQTSLSRQAFFRPHTYVLHVNYYQVSPIAHLPWTYCYPSHLFMFTPVWFLVSAGNFTLLKLLTPITRVTYDT